MRNLIHLPHGALPVVVAWHFDEPILALAWVIVFLAYEIFQGLRIKDQSYKDIQSFMIGFVVAALGMVIKCVWF